MFNNNNQLATFAARHVSLKNSELCKALEKAIDRDELSLVYQPIYHLAQQQIVGFEVLTRWQSPEHGFVSPDIFIAIAEKTGFIKELGAWIIQTAFEQYKDWLQKIQPNYFMAINISPQQFSQLNFISSIKTFLEKSRLPSSLIEFELTESSDIINFDEIKQTLIELHQLGFKLSLDDFGTGYSNFRYLKQLPIHTIKLDRTFVQDISNTAKDTLIVKSIIKLAKALKLNIIAEGFENQQQLDFLITHHCQHGQGYYFSKPLGPMQMFEKLNLNQKIVA